ncbi:MAG: type III-B CRISPR module RAMP protein Cmr4 [Thermoguttaceae bacterium]|jgi:CRISPR-associated protein Cmr4|nr:type III-B CRISPR module RAMP protein Cmr4 [Thermoguttaceae bacterium]
MSNASGHSPAGALLFLHAQTSLHPGSGTALGVVDLPVQRERHTQWPVIPGSTLKGILRDACREQAKMQFEDDGDDVPERQRRTRRQKANEEDPMLVAVFGPGKITGEGSSHAGALSVTDARILAFPVRSLRGVFAWVTCPAVLERLHRDLKLAGHDEIEALSDLKALGRSDAACSEDSPMVLADGQAKKLVLEEFEFTRVADANHVAEWIAAHSVSDEFTKERLKSHLVVLEDDYFTHFVRHATEVVARIGLDYEKKTVKEGALFYQEFLPAETLFYALVFASDSRAEKRPVKAAEVLKYVRSGLGEVKVLQIGGDETTGKGLCAVRLVNGKEGG